MKFLKHPIRAIREPFGTAGLIVACVALVAALGGTALAAAKLNGTQKKEVEKIAKKYAGKPGADGVNGATGPAGPNGAAGANGKDGGEGKAGTNGKSVTVTTIASGGSKCEGRAGAEVKQEGAASGSQVCNGKDGTTGFTETLPSGKTETGAWSITSTSSKEGFFPTTTVSFAIPLSQPGANKAFFFGAEETTEEEFGSSGCTGSVETPTAPQGTLCIYTGYEELQGEAFSFVPGAEVHMPGGSTKGYGKTGASIFAYLLNGSPAEAAMVRAEGTWAVTAP